MGDTTRGTEPVFLCAGYAGLHIAGPDLVYVDQRGPFKNVNKLERYTTNIGTNTTTLWLQFDPSLASPTGAVNTPRSWGALACVYLGQPARV